jgi:triosephosphate isomerase
MAYTFMAARGKKIGGSICEDSLVPDANAIVQAAIGEKGDGTTRAQLELPIDHLVADSLDRDANKKVVDDLIDDGWLGVDIGPKTIEHFSSILASAKTVFWNGPMGVFEIEPFANGTRAIAQAIADSDAHSVVGGGDSVTAINQMQFTERINHISTGGGASLEFLAGKELPGVAVIPDRRKLLIVGNWKMNHTSADTTRTLGRLVEMQPDLRAADVAICVPYTSLAAAARVLGNTELACGAQNVHWMERGAFTGEISAAMLKELGVEYVILGHSERRELFGETDVYVNLRLRAAIQAGLQPIVCVGETLKQRKAGLTEAVLCSQIASCLAGLSPDQVTNVIVAYEPVWAIGTGITPEPGEAQRVHAHIRRQIRSLYGKSAQRVRIQYGGSVTPDNVHDFCEQPDIDGALVGGASLDAETFTQLLSTVCL